MEFSEAIKGSQVDLPEFLEWIADRLVNVYGESPNIDFVHSCRNWAKKLRQVEETPSEEIPYKSGPSEYPPSALLDVCWSLEKLQPHQVNRVLDAAKIMLGGEG